MEDSASTPSSTKQRSRIRLGGLIACIGFLLYGGMFIAFGVIDEDVTEVVGGLGIVLVGVGVLIATRGM